MCRISSRLAVPLLLATGVISGLAIAQSAWGQSNRWTDSSGNEDWSDGANWMLGAPPNDSQSATFTSGGYGLVVHIGEEEARMNLLNVSFVPSFTGQTASEREITFRGQSPNDSFFIAQAGMQIIGEPEFTFIEFENLSVFGGNNSGVRLITFEASDKGRVDFLNSGFYGARGFSLEGNGTGEINLWGSIFRNDPTFTSTVSSNGRLQASNSTLDTPIENNGHWDVYDDTIFQGKKLTGSGTVKLNKQFEFLSFDPSGTDPVQVTNSITGPGGVKIASGTVTFESSNSFTGGLQLRGGILNASSAQRLGGVSSYLQFSGGTLRTTGGMTISIPTFVSSGGIDTNGNSIAITGDFDGPTNGLFTKSGTGTLTFNNNGSDYTGSYLVEAGTVVSGAGDTFSNRSKVTVNAGATLRFDGAENFEALGGAGVVNVNGMTIRLGYSDTLANDFSGRLTGAGVIEKLGGGSQRISGDTLGFSGTFLLTEGTLAFGSGEILGRDLSVPSNATVIFDPQSGSTDFDHTIMGEGLWLKEGAGTLNVTDNSADFTGLMSVGEGRLNVHGQVSAAEMVVTQNGTLGGSGNLNAPVYAEEGSTISPGGSIGQLTVATLDMLEGATLEVEVAGSGGVAGTDHDQLLVTGAAAINDAVLSVSLDESFVPTHGDQFQVLDIGGALTGAGFTSFDLQGVPGMAWDTSQLNTTGAISIEFSVTLPGDYNADGVVDAADYAVWRNHLGASANSFPNDPHNVAIGAAQYNTWRANYGEEEQATTTPAGNAPVPEPNTLLLMLLAGLLSVVRRVPCLRATGSASAW